MKEIPGNGQTAKPLVSVCMITYNHEHYLREALHSILSQETSFSFELVIGEDMSPDKTRAICEEYAARYPDIINLLPSDRRYGMMGNFIRSLEACKGEYIALCEGDDYWIDRNKLQKQVDFLETHKEFSICFHRARLLYQVGLPQVFPDVNAHTPEVTGLYDIMKGNYIHTPTTLFRNNMKVLPDWFQLIFPGDWPLHIINASFGKIFFMQDEMSVYRIHSGGILSTKKDIGNKLKTMETFAHLASFFKGKDKVAFDYFNKQYFHQKAFFKGIMNVDNSNRLKRFGILFVSAFRISKPKLIVASFLSLILPSAKLQKLWSKASQARTQNPVWNK